MLEIKLFQFSAVFFNLWMGDSDKIIWSNIQIKRSIYKMFWIFDVPNEYSSVMIMITTTRKISFQEPCDPNPIVYLE